ncbi:MAG TPA: IPT/TIG domain-containing protein, partial [Terriglobia bacterium]|nr:IPT/TIG domain-containing protein [Terriglobia bacterium]
MAVVLLTAAANSFGQSVLNFPRVISTPQSFTGLAISNPTSAEASITFTAFQPDGTLFTSAGGQNPLTVTIPAGGQYAHLATEIFSGSGTFNGWIQATSSTTGLVGFFLNANNTITDLDGAGAGIASAEFTLPLASEDGQSKTELTIVNPNSETSAVNLTLYAVDGSVLATKDLTIAGRGLIRQTLQPIFGSIDLTNASHVHVRSDKAVVGLEVVADFQIPQVVTRRETIEISGQQANTAQDYVLPEFVSGGGWASYLNIVNGSGLSQDITVTAYKDDGSLWDISPNPKTLTLAGNGSFKGTVEQFFGFSSSDVNTGWIKLHSPLGFVISNVGYGNVTTPSFAVVSGVDLPDASRLSVYSQVAEANGFFTGLTMVNPGSQPANVEFYALRPDGTTVGKSTFTIGPNQRAGKLFREILPASFGQSGGWAFLRSNQPVVGAALFGSTNGAALANVPAQTPAADFIPPAQTTAAITGFIHQDAAAIAGASVTLTGPVTTSLTTDFSGLFAFNQLPQGQYKVSVTLTGAQFFPSEQTVTVAQSNVDGVNFNAVGIAPAAAPAISFITPASVFGGGSGLSITVLGSNFNQASSIYLNGQLLPTSFVSDSELHAAVPSTLVATPGTLSVTVVTPPPGGGTSNIATLAVNVLPSNPLIDGNVRVGNFPAGVAIHPGRQIALVTNESGDSVSIVNLKTLQTAAEIKVGRSPSEGIAVYADKDLALVANTGSNNVSVIDLTANQVVKTIDVQNFPIGVAINPATRRALVTNFQSDSVSVIDLDSLSVVTTIPGLKGPSGVAINPNTNIAVITNRSGNSVSLIDLTSNSVTASVPVGQYPRGVAIDLNNNTAVIANANSGSVSIINIAAHSVLATVPVGPGPTGVAIHQMTNTAIVTNSGVTGGNASLTSVNSVSFVDLGQMKDVQDVQVESGPFGVDVDSDLQEAVVANYGSNAVTVVRIPNPTPLVTGVEPKTFPEGGPVTITVTGTGFLPTSVVTLNGQTLPTIYVSPTQLQAQVSASLLQQLLQPQAQTSSVKGRAVSTFAATAPVNLTISVN